MDDPFMLNQVCAKLLITPEQLLLLREPYAT